MIFVLFLPSLQYSTIQIIFLIFIKLQFSYSKLFIGFVIPSGSLCVNREEWTQCFDEQSEALQHYKTLLPKIAVSLSVTDKYHSWGYMLLLPDCSKYLYNIQNK